MSACVYLAWLLSCFWSASSVRLLSKGQGPMKPMCNRQAALLADDRLAVLCVCQLLPRHSQIRFRSAAPVQLSWFLLQANCRDKVDQVEHVCQRMRTCRIITTRCHLQTSTLVMPAWSSVSRKQRIGPQ